MERSRTPTPLGHVPTRVTTILPLLFVLSGAAGLIYEVIWARQLVLVFGNTSQAVSAILTAFFMGLAIGGLVGGWVADRVLRPLRLYAVLELALVLVVLLTPMSFRLLGGLYRGAYPGLSASPVALAAVRLILCILALAPATLLMGATLPTLIRFLTGRQSDLATAFTGLYTANTVGAIGGTVFAGFVLIETLGLRGALAVGALCSGAAGTLALLLDRSVAPTVASGHRTVFPCANAVTPSQSPGRHGGLALALAFASGLTSLGYQVVWNRVVSAGTGSSTYVFTMILALFLIGVALGAMLFGVLNRAVRSPLFVVAVAQVSTAMLVVIGSRALTSPSAPFQGATWFRDFAISAAAIVLPPTIALGITLPATSALAGNEPGREGSTTGRLLFLNTAGCLVATIVVPFVAIPLIGSPLTLAGLALTNIGLGAVVWTMPATARRPLRLLGAGATTVAALVVAMAVASRRIFRNPTEVSIEERGGRIFESAEDEIAAVQAGTLSGSPRLWVGGTSMTEITVDTKFMPLLPLMLRPDADRGLVIAFGMGTAFRTSLKAGVRTDAVELVPSVTRMFRWYYQDADAVLADPRGHLVVTDGRNYVELTSARYDFVVVDPPPPVESSGVSVISSLEFYRAAKARLTRGGVMVQWVPFGQTREEFLAHVRTYCRVFPNVRVMAGPGGAGFYMLGSEGPVELDPGAMRTVLMRPGVLEDINSAPDANGRSVEAWISRLGELTWASGDRLKSAVGTGRLVTDDRPLPEYFFLRRLLSPTAPPLTLSGLRELTR